MTNSLKESFKFVFKMALAIAFIGLLVFMTIIYAICDGITRRRKNVPMDAYPHL